MADTVITNTPGRSDDSSGAVGWIVALIVILAVIIAGFVWVRRDVGVPNTGGSGAGANINVTLPSGGDTSGGATGGAAGGSAQ